MSAIQDQILSLIPTTGGGGGGEALKGIEAEGKDEKTEPGPPVLPKDKGVNPKTAPGKKTSSSKKSADDFLADENLVDDPDPAEQGEGQSGPQSIEEGAEESSAVGAGSAEETPPGMPIGHLGVVEPLAGSYLIMPPNI